MKTYEKYMQTAFKIVDRQVKKYRHSHGKMVTANFVKRQRNFVGNNIMPPALDCVFRTFDNHSLLLMCNKESEFDPFDVERAIGYIDNDILAVMKNPAASQDDIRLAFMRISALGYMAETLIDVMVERQVLVLTPQFVAKSKSHSSALMNFISEVYDRYHETGKFGFSGSNHAEMAEFRDMWIGLVRKCYISEYYIAYTIVFNRSLANRLGAEVSDWLNLK